MEEKGGHETRKIKEKRQLKVTIEKQEEETNT